MILRRPQNFTLLLSYVVPVKSEVKISHNFVAFSEYQYELYDWIVSFAFWKNWRIVKNSFEINWPLACFSLFDYGWIFIPFVFDSKIRNQNNILNKTNQYGGSLLKGTQSKSKTDLLLHILFFAVNVALIKYCNFDYFVNFRWIDLFWNWF